MTTLVLMLLMLTIFLRMSINEQAKVTASYHSRLCPGTYATTTVKNDMMYEYYIFRIRCVREKWVMSEASDYEAMKLAKKYW